MTTTNPQESVPAVDEATAKLLQQLESEEAEVDQYLQEQAGNQAPAGDALGNIQPTEDSSETTLEESEATPEAKAEEGDLTAVKTEEPTESEAPKLEEQQTPEAEPDKSKEREARAWKKIEEQKQELERRQLAIAEKEHEVELREKEDRQSNPKDAQGNTVADYEAMAVRLDEQGRTELADAARTRAKELRDEAAQPAPVVRDRAKVLDETKAYARRLVEEFPAYGDNSTEAYKALNEAARLPEHAFLLDRPEGLYLLGRHLENAKGAAAAVELRAKLKELEEKNATLEAERLPSVGSSAPGMTGEKQFSDLSIEQMEAQMEAEIRAARG